MVVAKMKQYIRFQFTICINTIHGVSVENSDVLQLVWKTASHKGKLKTQTLKLDNFATQTQTINLWAQQHITFEDSLCWDIDAQAFDKNAVSFFLKREKQDMIETLGEFRTDLGLCANFVLTEAELSVDVPSQKFDHVKANITVKFKFLDKSSAREMYTTAIDSAGLTSSVQDLRQEMARVSNEYLALKTLVLDSQSFSKSDYWLDKLPEMELNLKQYTGKVDELSTFLHKILQDTKITVLNDKITDLQTKLFSEQDKLRRHTDMYQAFTQRTTQDLAALRESNKKHARASLPPVVGDIITERVGEKLREGEREMLGMGTWSHPPRANAPKHLSLHMINFNNPPGTPSPADTLSDISPLSSADSTPLASPARTPVRTPRPPSIVMSPVADPVIYSQLDESRERLERMEYDAQKMESDTQKLYARVTMSEADAQELHRTTEALKWERERDMENFYLFQRSQSQLAEEIAKLRLQIKDSNSFPRKLEQRLELLEVHMVKVKKAFAGMRLAGGVLANDGRASSTNLLEYSRETDDSSQKTLPQPSYGSHRSSVLTPAYHWFLLDHCFMFIAENEPAGDLLVPAYFLVRFCTNSLDLASCIEDWSVFDGLFFALHFQLKKHAKSPSNLLFWLSNTSFILEHLNKDVFSTFKDRELLPSITENIRTVVRELENFIKTIYSHLANYLSTIFESAVKSFSLTNEGDNENEWVTSVLAKLNWLEALLRSYHFNDNFLQNVLGDMYATMDTTLFNLICSDSSLCTPARASQVKFFLSSADNWACSEHPTNSKIIDRLCHAREAANLILGPKSNLSESSFRKSLFPNLTDFQQKHLLTIFTSSSPTDRLPPSLLNDLSAQITYAHGHQDLDMQVFTSHDLGAFFDFSPPSDAPIGRFSPTPVTDVGVQGGYAMVETNMSDVQSILSSEAFIHWEYLSRELLKWGRSKTKSEFNIPLKGRVYNEGLVDLAPEVVQGIQDLIAQCAL